MRAVGAALDQIPEPRLNRLRWTLAEDPGLQDDGLYEIGFVEGEIGTPAGDDRVYREGITRLAGLLGNDDAVQRVEIVRQPAAAGLQGNTAANPAPHAAVSFALKVWLKR
ncbi:MAG: hypothetical protein FIB01_12065 [Gemmatimonadetes bacterium]|nr:hypothetical protein [Gemmatimonadota bacterium]